MGTPNYYTSTQLLYDITGLGLEGNIILGPQTSVFLHLQFPMRDGEESERVSCRVCLFARIRYSAVTSANLGRCTYLMEGPLAGLLVKLIKVGTSTVECCFSQKISVTIKVNKT